MPIIYTLIARAPASVLIDSTNPLHTGNFNDIARKILANIPPAQQADHQKVTFVFEGHTFNFRAERGLLFMCMCDEAFGRVRPFSFLKDLIDTFFLMFSGEETALEGSIARSFRSVLTQKMKNYSAEGAGANGSGGGAGAGSSVASSLLAAEAAESEAKLNKMVAVKSELNSLASSARQNIDKVISRGEAIENLVDRTGMLVSHSVSFVGASTKLNRRLCWEDLKLKLMMAACIAILLYMMMSVYCGLDMRKCL